MEEEEEEDVQKPFLDWGRGVMHRFSGCKCGSLRGVI